MSNSKHDLTRLALDFQHDRLLRFEFEGEAPYPLLLANRIDGTESLSRDFQFTIEILSDHASLPARDFIGRKVTLGLLRGDGSQRYFNGHVFSFRQLGSDGACAFYEAVIGPWLRYLRYGRHNRLFLDRNLRRQTEAVFEDYGTLPDWAWHVGEDDPPVKMACQFGEHDHNYVHRRWEQPPAICAWLDSEASVDVIAGHIAHHLVGPGIGGQSVFWRFHDPRVFSLALAILEPAQRRALLGPVKSWTFPWAGHGWRVEAGQFAHESVDSPAGWPRPDQWPRIDRSAMAHEVCYRLASLDSAQAVRLPAIVDELFREALNQGLVASHEFVTFALQRLPHDFKLA
ncbi:contractile injection system protein, VgrG/Pvc8 family [Burkholderia gladioli]|uniref:contractile injection system protein, VgrG/Pvc8 family n=1 Tax=Burkholderia gladioli TaxID=28095 RepID=UPI00163F2242|nr:contractile injection system protein, VgrG/Pvc8 family [Burkholderia gladioli]